MEKIYIMNHLYNINLILQILLILDFILLIFYYKSHFIQNMFSSRKYILKLIIYYQLSDFKANF